MILLDGLYASGPIFDLCMEYGWDSMIVLKDKCLPSVWEDYHALESLNAMHYQGTWRGRRQQISWVNAISYAFKGADGKQKVLAIHVIVCEEAWEEVNSDTAEIETKASRDAGFPASRSLHKTCMNVAILVHAFVGGSRTVITPKNAVVIVTNISFRITGKRCVVFTICCAWPI